MFAILAAVLLTSCEKPIIDEAVGGEPDANVIIRVSSLEQMPFTRSVCGDAIATKTRAAQPVTALCTRLNFAIYQNGEKVKTVAQKQGDASFGSVALNLSEGTYQLVIIAHSSNGTATMTSEEKVTFPDNRVTDTFYYYGPLTVTAETETHDLALTRAVAMFRLVLTDDDLSDVAQMKFYYTGGSSTFSPATGYGSVNSRQTVTLDVPATPNGSDYSGADGIPSTATVLEVYTFPHAETGELKMTVTALAANGQTLAERTFERVPVTRNQITQYTGSFFGSGGSGQQSEGTFRLTADPDWSSVNGYTF